MRNMGEQIKYWREARNLTQQQLAELVDTERSNIAKIETGQSPGSVPLLQKLAAALGVSVADLLDEEPSTKVGWGDENYGGCKSNVSF